VGLDTGEALLVDSETNEVLLMGKPLLTSSIEQVPKKKYKIEFKTEDGETITRYSDFINIDEDNKTIYLEGMKIEMDEMIINFDKTSLL